MGLHLYLVLIEEVSCMEEIMILKVYFATRIYNLVYITFTKVEFF